MSEAELARHVQTMKSNLDSGPASPFDDPSPWEIGCILSALSQVGGSPSHRLATEDPANIWSERTAALRTSWYWFPTVHVNPLMRPPAYLHVLVPARPARVPCKTCDGSGGYECQVCAARRLRGDVRQTGSRPCRACDGTGTQDCADCDGSQGWVWGTNVTVVKTVDDYYVLELVQFRDHINPEWDPDPNVIDGHFFVCDQLSGVEAMLSDPRVKALFDVQF
jgi:hypothetical protein